MPATNISIVAGLRLRAKVGRSGRWSRGLSKRAVESWKNRLNACDFIGKAMNELGGSWNDLERAGYIL